MTANYQTEDNQVEQIEQLKSSGFRRIDTVCVIYSSLTLEYGLPASKVRDADSGLLLA